MRHALLAVAFVSSLASAAGPRPESIPPSLWDWAPWVLHHEKDALCPFLQGSETKACAWPGRLALTLDDRGGRFTQSFKVFGRDAWLPLPGDPKRWPQHVQVDGRPAVVVSDDSENPTVLLSAGEHSVTGDFEWDALPEALEIPPDTGLLTLSVKGQAVAIPNRDGEGRVFLQRETTQEETDRVEVDVHRLVTDEIPLTLVTQLTLKVSGHSREVLFGRALPEGFVPMELTSGLPVRVEPDGHLRLQVRPGTWVLQLTARGEGPIAQLSRPDPQGTWVDGEEVWVFDARPSLRQVLVEGVNAVDPTQTTLPNEWKGFPAYAMGPKDVLKLTERRRGDSEPAPDVLNLTRTLWLDFDGTGYTVSDKMSGQLHRSWRLDVLPGTELGRVVTSGADQSITRLDAAGKSGVELRQGGLALEADSRLTGDISNLSAVSWDADFNSVHTTLQLPPGWQLISASGADSVPGTWVDRWTLFDLFLVLIIAVAMARLFGVPWGVLAVVTLGLGWLEEDVPQYSWLVVLVLEGLFRVLPKGKLKSLFKVTRFAAWAALVVITVMFAVQHVREGMYPALAQHNRSLGGVKSWSEYNLDNEAQYARSSTVEAFEQGQAESDYDGAPPQGGFQMPLVRSMDKAEPQKQVQQKQVQNFKKRSFNVRDYDKNATVQTGPGLPRWDWRPMQIRFSGPVERVQRLSFFFLGPTVNLVLAFLRVFLLGLLVLCVLGFPGNFWPPALKKWVKVAPPEEEEKPTPPGAAARGAALLLVLLGGFNARAGGEDEGPAAPDTELLEQLRARLLEKPDCAPSCASIPRLQLEATAKVLRLRLEVLSGAETAVPLPGSAAQWVPETVLLDGKAASGLRREPDGTLWLAVPPGAHQVTLEGALPPRDTVQVMLPLRAYRVEAKLDGWTLDGLHEDGVADENLQLTRKATNDKGQGAALQMGTLPPFVRVERTLVLGLQWTVETRVSRVTPVGNAVVLEVPLLIGESVTSSDVRVQGGKALVNMGANATEVAWSSVLEAKAPLELTAPKGLPWVEVWRLDVSPVWHVALNGIPVVHQQDASGVRMPEWRPWPGEKVTVEVLRPEALQGQTLTIDQSSLSITAGARATDVKFTANFRSSRGGLHAFTLPPGASMQNVTINGSQQPIRQEGQTVNIPLVPGSQSVVLTWRETTSMGTTWTTPAIDVGTPTVNADIEVNVPRDRWVLLVRGPGLGPAVLFWSFLLVLLVVSIALSRTKLTPLSTLRWVLLALGLSQVPIPAIGFVFGWLLFLGWRARTPELTSGWFNLRQLAVVGVTFIALIILGASVYEGLLGQPEMQVRGNGSSASMLRWFMDRTDKQYPTAWVLSVPMLVYRGAMLAWSLWMALSLLTWLKWGWKSFSTGGLWRVPPPKPPPAAPPPLPTK
ncbi:MAG: hypothetical protein Q8L48_19895 [Archangium sp.]|nr:hypothetical protein [Archangium sp.]